MKIRFYLNDQAERIMALWSESRGEYLVADSVFAEVDACICGETDSSGEEMKRIAAFLDNPAAKAVDPDWMIDTALPCSPSKLVCLGKSYADHAKEFDGDPVQEPAIFLKSPSAITSCSDVVLYPPGCDKMDYEFELAVVIKNVLKNASPEEAALAISGYTLMCDYSERANQLEHGGQWTKGKSYDSFAPMGPTFISAEELGDGSGIPLELKVNGEVRQQGNTDGLIWPVPRLIAYISRFMTLWPGDVVSTGTPGGVGMGMNPPGYLKPGDVVEWGSPAFGYASQAVVIDDEE